MALSKPVRERIVAEHTRLRAELDGLLEVAARLRDAPAPVAVASERLRAFVRSLREHVDLEDRIWVADLERHGHRAQAEAMKAHHAVQRRALAALEADAGELVDPVLLGHRIHSLADEVSEDIELEDALLAGRQRSLEVAVAAILMSDQTR